MVLAFFRILFGHLVGNPRALHWIVANIAQVNYTGIIVARVAVRGIVTGHTIARGQLAHNAACRFVLATVCVPSGMA
jgi:hypothetical protein